MKHRQALIGQFAPDLVPSLIEFGKSLSTIEAELLVFMARKSVCLYDVLLLLGIPPIERALVSDRVLDMRRTKFEGRRVALIDDTLILGTTLAKTKKLLEEESGCSVTTHVFCLDRDWWSSELIMPDEVTLELDDRAVMSFCSSEVRAMSIAPRPYQVDFPISEPVRIRSHDAMAFLSASDWSCYSVSSDFQRSHGVSALSFFPGPAILRDLVLGFGQDIADILSIVKVRTYSRSHRGLEWTQVVPMVTLQPLSVTTLDELTTYLLDRLEEETGRSLEKIRECTGTVSARQRLVQYLLSVALGGRFFESLKRALASKIETRFQTSEAERLFGPWLHEELSLINGSAFQALLRPSGVSTAARRPSVQSAKLPQAVASYGAEALEDAASVLPPSRASSDHSKGVTNLLAYFSGIFISLFNAREIPARHEARALGKRALEVGDEEAPNRGRLEVGIPWLSVGEHFAERFGTELNRGLSNLLSLALDVTTDLGISVPTACVRENVAFRAYRHGEDALWGEAELGLAYETLRGFQAATAQAVVTKIAMEKVLVLLVKIGISKGFLTPLFGLSGFDGTVKIGFELMGPVPMVSRGPQYRTDRDLWLTDHLVNRGVIKRKDKGRFTLGEPVEANYLRPDVPDEAYELGTILGMLMRSSRDPARQAAPLSERKLTILATCWPPRHGAAALQAELDEVSKWFRRGGRKALAEVDWNSTESVSAALAGLLRSKAQLAINQAKFKAVAQRREEHKEIVEECTAFLGRSQSTDLVARKWKSYWSKIYGIVTPKERKTFDPYITECAELLREMALYFAVAEVSLLARLAELTDLDEDLAKRIDRAFSKLGTYQGEMEEVGFTLPERARKVLHRLMELRPSMVGQRRARKGQIRLFQTWAASLQEETAVAFVVARMAKLMLRVGELAEEIGLAVEEFGRSVDRRDYSYMVWYDVKDSTAARAGATGHDVEDYRRRVGEFKAMMNARLREMSHRAMNKEGEVYSWNGDLTSTNDEKHVFTRGEYGLQYALEVARSVLSTANSRDIGVRLYIVDCGLAGTRAYRSGFAPEVFGQRFWEHWSRVAKQGRQFEEANPVEGSFLVVAGDKVVDRTVQMPRNYEWRAGERQYITTEIELLGRRTAVRFGPVLRARR